MTGSSRIAAIHFSLLNMTCGSMLNPPQTFCRNKDRCSGAVDHDSRPCGRRRFMLIFRERTVRRSRSR